MTYDPTPDEKRLEATIRSIEAKARKSTGTMSIAQWVKRQVLRSAAKGELDILDRIEAERGEHHD